MRPAALSISSSGEYIRPVVVCLRSVISSHNLPDPGLEDLKRIAAEYSDMKRLVAVLWQFDADCFKTEASKELTQWMSTPISKGDLTVQCARNSWFIMSGNQETEKDFISGYEKCMVSFAKTCLN